jgi:hypothetical protein
MKIKTKLSNERITISEPMISDVYHIETNEDSGKFFIWSNNGYNSIGIVEFSDLEKAIKDVKLKIKNYFVDRGEGNPKGF